MGDENAAYVACCHVSLERGFMQGRSKAFAVVASWLLPSLFAVGTVVPTQAHAAGSSGKDGPQVFRTLAKVEIGAAGEIVSVVPEERLGSSIGSAVEKSVRMLSFAPAAVGGKPVAGVTYVRMKGCAAPLGQDQYRLAFEYEWHGPGQPRIVQPAYPRDALMRGISGNFDVQITVQPDGTARLDQVTVTQGGMRAEKAFADSIGAWVGALRYEPEVVAGKPVSTSLVVPLEFSLETSGRALKAEARKARAENMQSDACQLAFGLEQERSKATVALDSPFVITGSR